MSDIKNKFENFMNKTKEFAGKVKDGVVKNAQKFKEKLKPCLAKTKEVFSSVMSKVKETATKFADNTKDYFARLSGKDLELASRQNKFENFVNKTKEFAGKVKDGVVKNAQKFSEKLKPCLAKTKEVFSGVMSKVKETATKFAESTKDYFSRLSSKDIKLASRENKFENFVNKTKEFARKVKDGVVKNAQKFKEKIKLSIEKTKEKFDKNESPRKFYLPAVLPEQQNVTNAELKAKESTPKTTTKKEKVTPTPKKAIPKKPEAKESSTPKAVKSVPKKKNLPSTEIKNDTTATENKEQPVNNVAKFETTAKQSPSSSWTSPEKKKGFETTASVGQSADWSSAFDSKENDFNVPDYDKIFGLNNSNSETKDNSTPVEKVEPKTTEQNDSKGKEQIDKNIDNDSTQPTDHTQIEKVEAELLDSNEYKKFNDTDVDYTDSNEDIIDAEFTDVKDHKEEPKDSEIVNEEEKSESKPDVESEIKDEIQKTETIDKKGEEELKDEDTDKSFYTFEKAKDYYHVDLSKKGDSEKFTGTPVVDLDVDESKKEEAPKPETIEKTDEDIKEEGKSEGGKLKEEDKTGEDKKEDKTGEDKSGTEEFRFFPKLDDDDSSHGFTDFTGLPPTYEVGSSGTAGLPPDSKSGDSKEKDSKIEPPKDTDKDEDKDKGKDSDSDSGAKPPKEKKPIDLGFSITKLLAGLCLTFAVFMANPILLFLGIAILGFHEVISSEKEANDKGKAPKPGKTKGDKDITDEKYKVLAKEKKALAKLTKADKKLKDKLAELDKKKEKAYPEEDRAELARLREKKRAGKDLSPAEKKDLAKLSKKEHNFDRLVKKYDKMENKFIKNNDKINDVNTRISEIENKHEIYNLKAYQKIQQQNDLFNKQREQLQNEIASKVKEIKYAADLIKGGKLSSFGEKDISNLESDFVNLRDRNYAASRLENPENEHNAQIMNKLDKNPFDKSSYDEIKDSVDFSKVYNDKINELGLNKSTGTLAKIKASDDYKKVIEASKTEKKELGGTELSTGK